MDWSKAVPSLVESGIGLVLLLLAAGIWLFGHSKGADVDDDERAPGCVIWVLVIIGGIVLWHGLDAFDSIVSQIK